MLGMDRFPASVIAVAYSDLLAGVPGASLPSGVEVVQVNSADAKPHGLAFAPRTFERVREMSNSIAPEPLGMSLAEIQAQLDVEHLAAPKLNAEPDTRLRVVVCGDDRLLSSVISALMRWDLLWVEVAYVPLVGVTPAARIWEVPADPAEALTLALSGSVHPMPLIRDDNGVAVAGLASITSVDGGPMVGEVFVDSSRLFFQADARERADAAYGVRLAPMPVEPGIAAVQLDASAAPQGSRELGFFGRIKAKFAAPAMRPPVLLQGRAVQAGGPEFVVTVDGQPRRKPVDKATFYRHLRDLHSVRPRA